jgi:hypothetical protein
MKGGTDVIGMFGSISSAFDFQYTGKMYIDKSFNSADTRLKQFAIKKFKEFIDKDNFQQF